MAAAGCSSVGREPGLVAGFALGSAAWSVTVPDLVVIQVAGIEFDSDGNFGWRPAVCENQKTGRSAFESGRNTTKSRRIGLQIGANALQWNCGGGIQRAEIRRPCGHNGHESFGQLRSRGFLGSLICVRRCDFAGDSLICALS